MKVKLIFTDTSKPFAAYEKYLPLVSEQRKNKIRRFRFEKDKTVSLFTELLMRHEISNRLNIPCDKIVFSRNNYGKPYLADYADYRFSVSHSGNCIVFTDSYVPVGIDIEKIAEKDLGIAKRFFAADETEFIFGSPQPTQAFYKIWTAKEAYVKMLGTGLSTPLTSFSVLSEELKGTFLTCRLAEYFITVCSSKKIENESLETEELNEKTLFL